MNEYDDLSTEYRGFLETLMHFSDKITNRGLTDLAEELNEIIFERGMRMQNKLDQFICDFKKTKSKKISLENKIAEIENQIDELHKQMPNGDKIFCKKICEQKYSEYWDKLDSISKEFLIVSHWLFNYMKSTESDFSPVIIELCRSFENEVKTKIFDDYINIASQKPPLGSNEESQFLYKAIIDVKRNNRYFLSLSNMLSVIQELNIAKDEKSYTKDLYLTLNKKGWDIQQLTDNSFLDYSRKYTNKYRNQSAHPTYIEEDKVGLCIKDTDYLLKRFSDCQKATNRAHSDH